jgi:elongation factor 1-gamma
LPAREQDNPRTTACRIVAKANELDLELVEVTPGTQSPEYLKISPLGKYPAFVGANGFVLTECIAIAVYSTSLPVV